MRMFALLLLFSGSALPQSTKSAAALLELAPEQRLDIPQRVTAASLKLTDFVSFVSTTYKVPILAEITSNSIVRIPTGTFTARELLNNTVAQLGGFTWTDKDGIAHFYDKHLVTARGNILNTTIPHFAFPHTVGEFMYLLRPCIDSVIQGYGCKGGAYTGFQTPQLEKGTLPYGRGFSHAKAREILLSALEASGRFYVLIAFESTEPRVDSKFPFENWFARSLETDAPSPIWIQPAAKKSK